MGKRTGVPAKVPRDVRNGVTGLAREFGLEWRKAAFLAIRALGASQGRAYSLANPDSDADERSAAVIGSRWETELPVKPSDLPLDLAQHVLADWVSVECMADARASWRDRLTAADQANKRGGRYREDPAVNVTILARDLNLGDGPEPEPMPTEIDVPPLDEKLGGER